MIKARDEHGLKNAKVKGRFLYIDKDRYDYENIPDFLKKFNILVITTLFFYANLMYLFWKHMKLIPERKQEYIYRL